MSGRPADPSYSTRTFAPDADYPSGPNVWNGQATKVEPPGAASVGFEPETSIAAEEMNKLFFDAYTQDANAKAEIAAERTRAGQVPALNFPIRTSGPAATTQAGAFYVKATRRWYLCAANEDVRSSKDACLSWQAETGLATAGAGEETYNGDGDDSGNVVIATDEKYVFALNFGTSTWTKVDTGASAFSYTAAVVFDPIRSKWLWIGTTAGTPAARTSTDRATWSAATAPPGGAVWAAATSRLSVRKSDGRILFVATNGSNVRSSYTDDAGTTWSAGVLNASTIASPTEGHLSYNEADEAWYYVIGETSGTPTCEVWRSEDGATWTKQKTFSSVCLTPIGGIGALLVAVATSGDVVLSKDRGVTWYYAGFAVETSPKGVFIGGANRPLIVTGTNVYPGLAMGMPNLGTVA